MIKYFGSRFILVLLIKFFTGWLDYLNVQFHNFFDLDNRLLHTFFFYFLLISGIVAINLIFSLIRHFEESSDSNSKNIYNPFYGFFDKISDNFRHEVKREKFPFLFILTAIIFIGFISSNPLFHNYTGVYKLYEYDTISGESNHTVNPDIIYNNNEYLKISSRIQDLENKAQVDSQDYEVGIKQYLFVKAGLFDGFVFYNKDNKGFKVYLECLLYALLEKSINTFLYFLLPLLFAILLFKILRLIRKPKKSNKINTSHIEPKEMLVESQNDLIERKRLSLDRNRIARELMKVDDENPIDGFYNQLPALIEKERDKRLEELRNEKAERLLSLNVWIQATCDLMTKYPNVDVDELHGEEYRRELKNRIDEIIINIHEEYKKIFEEEEDNRISENSVSDELPF